MPWFVGSPPGRHSGQSHLQVLYIRFALTESGRFAAAFELLDVDVFIEKFPHSQLSEPQPGR
jgi:hypothetical protein